MSELQQFGGDWTIEKLDILTGYLDAYLTALKNFHFKKIYIDAFAGTGSITTRDGQREIAGSARLVLPPESPPRPLSSRTKASDASQEPAVSHRSTTSSGRAATPPSGPTAKSIHAMSTPTAKRSANGCW